MPKVIRPRQEFPTPAFRTVMACASALAGVAPALVLLGSNPWIALPAAAGGLSAPIVALRGTTGRRLTTAAVVAILVLLGVDLVAVVIAFVTHRWG
jgi:hypothetical protein